MHATQRCFDYYTSTFPDRLAVVEPDGVTRHTFGEVGARADLVSRLLVQRGIERGDVVCTLMPNIGDTLIVQRGALRLPVYFTLINRHYTVPEVAYILSDSRAHTLFTTVEHAPVATAALESIGRSADDLVLMDADASHPRSFAALTAGLAPGRPEETTAGARRMYTSGTTGHPKAVHRPLPNAPVAQSSAAFHRKRAHVYGVDHEEGVFLSVAPLHHAAPSSYADQALDLGQTVVLMQRWDAAEAARLIERERVTWMYLVPLMMQELLALDPRPSSEQMGSLKGIFHTAAPCPPDVKRAMIDWVGPILTEGYGGTEGSATAITSEEWLARPGSVGKALDGVRLEIRDDEGNALPAGTVGKIYYSNPGLSFSYHNDPTKTAAARIGDAITIGDIGYLDDDGYLFLSDREADVVISGGVNIYPAEVEHALERISGIVDACVIGVPDERWGQALRAQLVLDEAAPDHVRNADADPDELIAELREQIASYKIPRSFEIVDELPYSDVGKLLRRRVRDDVAARLVP